MSDYRAVQKELANNLGLKRLLPINRETMPEELFLEMWERIKLADYAFEDSAKEDLVAFIRGVLAEGTYSFEIPDELFCQIVNADRDRNAVVHFITLHTGPTSPMLDAAAELFGFAFDQIGVQRITAFIPSFNQKTIRLASLMRMKFEGQMRKAFLYNTDWWDIHIYGLLKHEWQRRG
jgi:RimJ/RimL family protein N-acetyltransferase